MNKLLIFPRDPLAKGEEGLKKLIAKNHADINRLCQLAEKTYKNFVRPYMEFADRLHLFFAPIAHLNGVKNSEKSQEVFRNCLPLLSEYETVLSQDNRVYNAFIEILKNEENSLDFAQKKVLKDTVFEFELEGVNLPADKKDRLKVINSELSALSECFNQNVLNATKKYKLLITDENDLGSMPANDKQAAGADSGWEFTLQMPSYIAFMTYSPNREKREDMYKAYCTRAPENGELIEKILALRTEKAHILGFENFAALNLKNMSAPNTESVLSFLFNLADMGKPHAAEDMETLKKYAAKDGISDFDSHDTAYYTEIVKKAEYDYDEEALQAYFETDNVVRGLFTLLGELFSLTFKKIASELWDDDAEYYQVFRTEPSGDKKFVGGLFLDLYTRPEKRGGAWMDNWRTFHFDDIESFQRPEVFLVGNFPAKSTKAKSLLRHSDVATLFHEMGHGLHHLMSTVKEVSLSGVNGIDWDTVEFPSQFLENFAYTSEVLNIIGVHHITGEKIPPELANKIVRARNFHAGMLLVRQLEFSLFDMLIHCENSLTVAGVQKILDETREKVSVLIPKSYNRFQHGFLHIFSGGYAAGYYSYKWAEMLAADAFLEFQKTGVLNKELADRYCSTVLALGASKKMSEIYKDFLGRDADPQSILKLAGLI